MKKLRDEARATCATLEDVAKQLLAMGNRLNAEEAPAVSGDAIRHLAHRLGHQGGRLDMALQMTRPPRTRRKR